MKQESFFYETHLKWTGLRRGLIEAPGLPSMVASAPPEFQGEAGFWTPEHLLLAALESCVLITFLAVAQRSQIEVVDYRSSSTARLDLSKERGLEFTEITLRSIVRVTREQDQEKVRRAFEKTKKRCLISNALHVPVDLGVSIELYESVGSSEGEEAA